MVEKINSNSLPLPDNRSKDLKYHNDSIAPSATEKKRTTRLMELARPRQMHPEYQISKSAIPLITKAALEAIPSPRIEEISQPLRKVFMIENEWRVKNSALSYRPSERILELSRPRPFANGYMACKSFDETWRVSTNARKASSSERIEELSKPHIRAVGTKLPRTDAFIVSAAAKKAIASERIIELSQPIIRGK
ncbi:testicular haploid expressed gene protein-like [Xenia sp. Carnegie-2017]|uniref:testicular haploid expressed gene protein-like n=1 Tax=Xenia sp. Carnegie-2017 TaxID=2897299 RepID=UPI001F040825|nr:testicular haploid expressed gene protein-like [Xenia sp. Carnegie-2017]